MAPAQGPRPKSACSPVGLCAMVPGSVREAHLGQRARVSSSHFRKVWARDLTSSQAACLRSLGDRVNVSTVLANNPDTSPDSGWPPPGPSEERPLWVPFPQPRVGEGSPPCPTTSADFLLRTRQETQGGRRCRKGLNLSNESIWAIHNRALAQARPALRHTSGGHCALGSPRPLRQGLWAWL